MIPMATEAPGDKLIVFYTDPHLAWTSLLFSFVYENALNCHGSIDPPPRLKGINA